MGSKIEPAAAGWRPPHSSLPLLPTSLPGSFVLDQLLDVSSIRAGRCPRRKCHDLSLTDLVPSCGNSPTSGMLRSTGHERRRRFGKTTSTSCSITESKTRKFLTSRNYFHCLYRRSTYCCSLQGRRTKRALFNLLSNPKLSSDTWTSGQHAHGPRRGRASTSEHSFRQSGAAAPRACGPAPDNAYFLCDRRGIPTFCYQGQVPPCLPLKSLLSKFCPFLSRFGTPKLSSHVTMRKNNEQLTDSSVQYFHSASQHVIKSAELNLDWFGLSTGSSRKRTGSSRKRTFAKPTFIRKGRGYTHFFAFSPR